MNEELVKKTKEAEREVLKSLQELTRTYAYQLRQALRAWESSDMPQMVHFLEEIPASFWHTWEYRYLQLLSQSPTRTFNEHRLAVLAVATSPNGKRFATAGADRRVQVWNARTGTIVWTKETHEGYVTSIAYSPDGKWLASGSRDKFLKVWEADTGEEYATLGPHDEMVTGDGRVSSVAFNRDSTRVASASHDGTIKIWDIKTRKLACLVVGPKGSKFNVIAYKPTWTRLLLTGSSDGSVTEWDTDGEKGMLRRTLR